MLKSIVIVASVIVLATTACEPTVGVDARLDYDYPYCPTTDSLYAAADSVPLGCPVPADTLP